MNESENRQSLERRVAAALAERIGAMSADQVAALAARLNVPAAEREAAYTGALADLLPRPAHEGRTEDCDHE